MSVVIQTHNLTKVYEAALGGQSVKALTDLSIAVEEKQIFGYLGPNGSGKTTTIKMLLGLIFPTSGKIQILGSEDVSSPAVKRNIGYLPEGAYYPDFLKGEEILRFYGQLYGLSGKKLEHRIDEAMEIVGMTRARKRLLRGYSKGMRQRIGLAQALLSDPQILILDEPTTGLDPVARRDIRDLLVRLRSEGKTLMISTHDLIELELICDRVAILNEGILRATGTMHDLLMDRETSIEAENVSEEAIRTLANKGIMAEEQVNGSAVFRVPKEVPLIDAIELSKAANVTLVSVRPRRETLEELFVRVITTKTPTQDGKQ